MSASASADLGAHDLAVVAVEVAEHLLGRLEVVGALAQLAGRVDDGLELVVAPGDLLVARPGRRAARGRPGALRRRRTRAPAPRAGPTSSEGYGAVSSRQSPSTATTSAGRARRAASGAVTGWASRSGTTRSRRASGSRTQAGVGGGRHEVEVDRRPSRRPRPGAPSASAPTADGDAAGRGGWAGARRPRPARSSAQADAAGLGDEAGPQPALGRELVERVRARRRAGGGRARCRCTRASWSTGRQVAVEHARSARGRRGPTPTSSSGSSIGVPAVVVAVDDAGDLEPEDLAAHDAVLDDHLEVGVDEQLGQLRRRAAAAARPATGGGRGGHERRCPSTAHTVGRGGEAAPARRASDADVAPSTSRWSSATPAAVGPHQRRARATPAGRRSSEEPARSAGDERGAARERPGRRLDAPPRCGRSERRQLGGEERPPASVSHVGERRSGRRGSGWTRSCGACRSGARSGRCGRRCPPASACPCRRGGTRCRARREVRPWWSGW